MKVALLAHGTRGDVQPALALGDRLAHRGHEVALCVNHDLAGWASRSGMPVVASELDVGRFLHSEEARRMLASGRIGPLVRRVTADERRVNPSIVEACVDAAHDADLVVSTIGMALRGLCLGRALGVPAVNLLYAPLTTTAEFASIASPVRDLRVGTANRATYRAFHTLLWRQSRANLDDMCHRLDLPRLRRASLDQLPGLHAYSPRLVRRPRDWSPDQQLVGPAVLTPELGDRLGEPRLSQLVVDWVADGPPVVYVGLGSIPVPDPRAALADVAAVTADLGVRGIVASGWTDYGVRPDELPAHLLLLDGPVDHERLLPLCAAAVHHGGSGTTAAVARAGIPSVVLSVFLDQPFWGWRLETMGFGATMPLRRLTRARLARALGSVLDSRHRQRAHAYAAVLCAEDGAGRAADLLEKEAFAEGAR